MAWTDAEKGPSAGESAERWAPRPPALRRRESRHRRTPEGQADGQAALVVLPVSPRRAVRRPGVARPPAASQAPARRDGRYREAGPAAHPEREVARRGGRMASAPLEHRGAPRQAEERTRQASPV